MEVDQPLFGSNFGAHDNRQRRDKRTYAGRTYIQPTSI